MYLSHCCFVLVIVTVSASYLDEDLPLYLSDDILISHVPKISKRSISDAVDDGKLTKRDVNVNEKTEHPLAKKEDVAKDKSEIENEEESGLVFIPSFGRRTRRAIAKNEKDLLSSENNIVFLPSFRRNGFRRTRRDVGDADTDLRYTKQDSETPIEDKGKKSGPKATENNEESSDSDGQESGLVFFPSFGRRSRRSVEENQHISSTQKNVKDETPTTTNKGEINNQEKINPQKSTVKTKREVSNENLEKKKTQTDDFGGDKDDESEEESGLVFLPSFGRRQRRDTSSSKTNIDSNSQKEEKQTKKTFDAQESGLVFLPSFNRRTRRDVVDTYSHYIKRSVDTSNENDKKKKSAVVATEKNEELSDSDVVNGEESGLVFLPSFGRRSRRSVLQDQHTSSTQKSIRDERPTTTNEDSNVASSQKEEKQTKKTFDTQESGLVFLPSFNRRTRRDIPINESKKSEEKLDNSNKKQDEEEQESGLVFLPSFGRKT